MSSCVTVDTGNVNSIQEMVIRRHKNSSAEVLAAFQHFSASDSRLELKNGVFAPEPQNDVTYSKADMKITLKVFLVSFSVKDLLSAVDVFLATRQLDQISQLIVAFPFNLAEDLSDEEWLDKVTSLWTEMENLVEKGTVHTLGVSDLDVDRLRLLCDSASAHPPSIDHYSIDGCCTVPAELVEFAKGRDIQLLTHNDSRHFELDDSLKGVIAGVTGRDLSDYKETWTARYTIWLRSRSIVAGKGYFVNYKSV